MTNNRDNRVEPEASKIRSGTRTLFVIEFDGTDFSGFQIQNNARTVQGEMEKALSKIYKQTIRLHGCSRTDAGVHARRHVSHADLPFRIPEEKIPLALNTFLPQDICVIAARIVDEDFHARFDSRGKRYIYRISDTRCRPSIYRRTACHVPVKLSVERMQEAANHIIGTHDFSAFCASEGLDKNPIRTVNRIEVLRQPITNQIEIMVTGESFLYNMVRIIAGTLVYVSQNKLTIDDVDALFINRDRRRAGKTMPAHGLMLDEVFYDRVDIQSLMLDVFDPV
ncbi:MAG: tRNA pseudouridine(38-40) synthase TruA [Clostridiaceae bacterium]|nr:tRNA pseudouridine(38-40) synthase TruA [Clostridiaceae bacterium]